VSVDATGAVISAFPVSPAGAASDGSADVTVITRAESLACESLADEVSVAASASSVAGAAKETAASGAKGMKKLGIAKVRKLKTAHGGHARTTSKINGPNKRIGPMIGNNGAGIGGSNAAVVVTARAAASAAGGFIAGLYAESILHTVDVTAVGVVKSAVPPATTVVTGLWVWARLTSSSRARQYVVGGAAIAANCTVRTSFLAP
jgi:hypothetical protein